MTAFHIVTGGQRSKLPWPKDYEPKRIKIAMFKAMEGMAKDHAANIDQYGVLTALEILEGMDWLYGVSMTFQLLNAALCGLQQRSTEMCRDYYDRFTQITILLWERHSNRFHPGELARMSKDCFSRRSAGRAQTYGGSPERPL